MAGKKQDDPAKTRKQVRQILDAQFWIQELSTERLYQRLHDDTDGEPIGRVMVMFDRQGDAYISTDSHYAPPLRFRSGLGGGRSLRVRNALMILAYAIELDNETLPDP